MLELPGKDTSQMQEATKRATIDSWQLEMWTFEVFHLRVLCPDIHIHDTCEFDDDCNYKNENGDDNNNNSADDIHDLS